MPWIAPIVAYLFDRPKVRLYCPRCVANFGIDPATAYFAARADDPPHCEDPCDGCGQRPDLNVPRIHVEWRELRP